MQKEGNVLAKPLVGKGHHLVLEKCGNIDAFPVRKTLISRLNKEWKKDLGPNGCNFNAIQSNLYSGSFQTDDVSSLDHIGFHKDGRYDFFTFLY